MKKKITPCLWLDNRAEKAATFYTSIFKKSKIKRVWRYGEAGQEIHGGKPGAALMVEFELNGQPFTALNGGPAFKFTEALSLQVYCETQKELDHYWDKLSEGGDPNAQQCGWLKDKFGVSWQIIPAVMGKLMNGKDREKSDRVMLAMLKMKKLDIQTLEAAYKGAAGK